MHKFSLHSVQTLLLGGILCLSMAALGQENPQFVSLTLCSDRLLIAIARPQQIAAMSPYSKNPLMMLDKVNVTKPVVQAKLDQLLPYANTKLLINDTFYPRLMQRLKGLGFDVIPINDAPQTPQALFELILKLGKITHNEPRAKQLVQQLKNATSLNTKATKTAVVLSETGVQNLALPQYKVLLQLLHLQPIATKLTQQHFSLEKMLLANPDTLIALSDHQGYHQGAQLLSHPLLKDLAKNRSVLKAPLKYTYCFDQGVWQGAKILSQQAKQQEDLYE